MSLSFSQTEGITFRIMPPSGGLRASLNEVFTDLLSMREGCFLCFLFLGGWLFVFWFWSIERAAPYSSIYFCDGLALAFMK